MSCTGTRSHWGLIWAVIDFVLKVKATIFVGDFFAGLEKDFSEIIEVAYLSFRWVCAFLVCFVLSSDQLAVYHIKFLFQDVNFVLFVAKFSAQIDSVRGGAARYDEHNQWKA